MQTKTRPLRWRRRNSESLRKTWRQKSIDEAYRTIAAHNGDGDRLLVPHEVRGRTGLTLHMLWRLDELGVLVPVDQNEHGGAYRRYRESDVETLIRQAKEAT
jgi:hypothetical protein